MRTLTRISSLALFGFCTVVLVACGSGTVTVEDSTPGPNNTVYTVYTVLSGTASDVSALQDSVKQRGASNAPGHSETVVDGDQHQGSYICDTDIKRGGHSAHAVVYANWGADPSVCTLFVAGS